MRASGELTTPLPLRELLPSVFLDDPMTRSFTEGLDPMLAPVHLTLDCLDAYLDPRLTPADFLPWLASWVGIEPDETLPEPRQRALIVTAGWLHRVHGTRAGLVRLLEIVTGGVVEVGESGGALWSTSPNVPPPGHPVPGLQVVVRVSEPSASVQRRVERAVRDFRPAHLPFRVEVLPLEESRPRSVPPAAPGLHTT